MKAGREAAVFLTLALVVGFFHTKHSPDRAGVRGTPTTMSHPPAMSPYTGPVTACDLDGHRVVTDPADARERALRPCYTAPTKGRP